MFTAMKVRDLPPPHNPYKCFWFERFEAFACRLREETAGHWFDLNLAAGEQFLETLTAQDRLRCPYDDADWAAIADQSVRTLKKLGCDQDVESYTSAARRSAASRNATAGYSSFSFWSPSRSSVAATTKGNTARVLFVSRVPRG